jgi:hypothetical protein
LPEQDNKPHNSLLFHLYDDVMGKIYSFTKNEFNLRCRNCLISFKNSWIYLLGFMFLFLWAGFSASSQITIDGNPVDWNSSLVRSNATYVHVIDNWGKGTDNQFTKGSKDFMFAKDLRWSKGQVSNKTDIANAAAVIIGCELYFAGDRLSTNGNANIGFWFYLNGTAPQINPVTGAYDFAPEHAVGDILVIADFSNGGTFSTITVYKWVGTGGSFGGGTLDLVPETNATVAQNNVYSHPVPTDWSYITPDYPTNAFYEGMIDLCALNLDNYCFTSFLLETRNSNSINAMLGDFVAGAFGAKPTITATGGSVCEPGGMVELCAVSTDANLTYQWYTNPELSVMVPNGDTKCISVNVTSTTNYWVVATNELKCTSDAVMVTATVYPSVPCLITGSLEVCPNGEFTYMGPADMLSYSWSISGNATIVGATDARMVTIKTGENCEDFTLSLDAIDAHGCASNCLISVNVKDDIKPVAAECPSEPVDLGCNPVSTLYAPSLVPDWSDNCGIKESGVRQGTPVADADGCGMTVTHVYYAVDWCGNEQTCSQVFKWTIDTQKPTVVCPPARDLGLNPAAGTWGPSDLQWADNCGLADSGVTAGTVTGDNCTRSITHTHWAVDICGNSETCEEVITWTVEYTCDIVVDVVPVFGENAGQATVYVKVNGVVSSNEFTYEWFPSEETTQTTYELTISGARVTVTDEFGCETTCEVPMATADCTPLMIDLGCNPDVPDGASVIANAKAHYESEYGGTFIVTNPLIINEGSEGCFIEQTWEFDIEDEFGNIENCEITYTWKEDGIAPVIVDIADYQLAECNAAWPALLTTTWTDNCGVDGQTSGSVVSDGGVNIIVDACIQTRLYTFTVTDDCGNVATQTVTVSRKYDETAPVIVDIPDYMPACRMQRTMASLVDHHLDRQLRS